MHVHECVHPLFGNKQKHAGIQQYDTHSTIDKERGYTICFQFLDA